MATDSVSAIDKDTWTLIDSRTPTSGTSVSFTSISGYKTLLLAAKNITTNVTGYLTVRLNNDSTAGDYIEQTGAGEDFFYVSTNDPARAMMMIIYDANQDVPHKIEKSSYQSSAFNNPVFYTDPVAITRVDLLNSTAATFTGGTVYLYGIAG